MVRTILITGSTDGIGKHLAKKLASEGHEIILHGRNPKKLEETLKEVRAISPRGRVSAYRADFSQLEEVYQFTKAIKQDFSSLDVLFNNAGVFAGDERVETAEKVEMTFMLSVLVPYILTKELEPLLEHSVEGRVINTSSYMHHFAKVKHLDFDLKEAYSPRLAYNNAKLYTIWLTRYLARNFYLKGSTITINSYHPGLISTNLGNASSDEKTKKSLFARFMKSMSKDVDEGIKTGYYLTLSNQVSGVTGAYFDDQQLKHVSDKGYSLEKAQKLVDYCEQKIQAFQEKKPS